MRAMGNRWIIVAALVLVVGTAAGEPAPFVDRLGTPGLEQTILEALAYLEDNQVRDRPGRGSPMRDSSDEGDGCRGRTSVNLPCHENVGLPGRNVRNRPGEWASHYHVLPNKTGFHGRSIVATQDSNTFVAAAVTYGLLMFDDFALPCERRFVSQMVDLSLANIAGLKRDDAYNFWPLLPGVEGPFPRTGPINQSLGWVRWQSRIYANHRCPLLVGLLTHGQRMPPRWWIAACLDPHQNPAGIDAIFNTPNDADDTSVAVGLQATRARHCPHANPAPDVAALARLADFRDLARCKEDWRDTWKGKDTGAYLTWLRDENEPAFADPYRGVMSFGVNNVDAVVNANAAWALGVSGMKHLPGYPDCLHLLARTVVERQWPAAGIYYPQYMMFPYAVSRAYREGSACDGPMPAAMRLLMCQVLDAQEAQGLRHPERWGAFPGGEDQSDHFATAIGLSTLLNLGRPMACEIGQAARFDRAIHAAARYLIRVRKPCRIVYGSTQCRLGAPICKAAVWDSGLFFGSGSDMAHWRSQAITASAVIEALAKYAAAADLDPHSGPARRLSLVAGHGPCAPVHLAVIPAPAPAASVPLPPTR